MNKSKTEEKQQLRGLFEQGMAAAADPINNNAIQQGGAATTTLNSSWLHQKCSICTHTFRLGDEVEIRSQDMILHNTAMLPCAEMGAVEPVAHAESTAFFRGLDEAWPSPSDVPVVRLETGHRLLAPPRGGFQRHSCVVCRHTLRLHDHVVICPCSPDDPQCRAAVHRDPLHGLHCLEAWNPSANWQAHCPITSRRL